MPEQESQGQGKLEKVVDIEQTYGYDEEKKKEEEKKGDAWLKMLLDHLKEKKKMYMRPVVPER